MILLLPFINIIVLLSSLISAAYYELVNFKSLTTNPLGLPMSVEKMTRYYIGNGWGVMQPSETSENCWFYSQMASTSSCFIVDTSKYRYVRLTGYWIVDNGVSMTFWFQYNSPSVACTTQEWKFLRYNLAPSAWKKDQSDPSKVYAEIDLLSAFTGTQADSLKRVTGLYLDTFSPAGKFVAFQSMGLHSDCLKVCPSVDYCGESLGRGNCNCGSSCTCNTGWRGARCECESCPNECSGLGICNCDGTCACNVGRTGSDCSKIACPSPCLNGGTCADNGVCNCPRDFTGRSDCGCKTPITGTCVHGTGTYSCETGKCNCASGWAGELCDCQIACSPKCLNNGTCRCDGTCDCPTDWRGSSDCSCRTKISNPCSSVGWSGSYICASGNCQCKAGWTGPLCDCTTAACSPTCKNGGVCQCGVCVCPADWRNPATPDCSCKTPLGNCNSLGSVAGSFECSTGNCVCKPGWTGPNCDCSITCPNNCSLGNGVCQCGGICKCNEGWQGNDCSCKAPPANLNCENSPASFEARYDCATGKCNCLSGWTGDSCNCSTACPNNCSGIGVCNCGVCSCPLDWNGKSDCSCKTPQTSPPCVNGNGTFDCATGKCNCLPGWTGDSCNCSTVCLNNCSGIGVCNCGVCSCPDGWKRAPDCSCKDPFDSNQTINATCVYNCTSGLCRQQSGNSSCSPECFKTTGTGANGCNGFGGCSCLPGWTGSTCTCMECTQPCQNGGSCDCGTCKCLANYTGPFCEKRLCSSECLNSPNYLGCSTNGTCVCREGWTGDQSCQNKTCASDCNAEQGGGYCRSDGICVCSGDYMGADCKCRSCPAICANNANVDSCGCDGSCICKPSYWGPACQNRNCSKPCQNGGICSRDGTCQCLIGFSGQFCDIDEGGTGDNRAVTSYPVSATSTIMRATSTAIISSATSEPLMITDFSTLYVNNLGFEQGGRLSAYYKGPGGGAVMVAQFQDADWYSKVYDRSVFGSSPLNVLGKWSVLRIQGKGLIRMQASVTVFLASSNGQHEEYFSIKKWRSAGDIDYFEIPLTSITQIVDPTDIGMVGLLYLSPLNASLTFTSIMFDSKPLYHQMVSTTTTISDFSDDGDMGQSVSSFALIIGVSVLTVFIFGISATLLYMRYKRSNGGRGRSSLFSLGTSKRHHLKINQFSSNQSLSMSQMNLELLSAVPPPSNVVPDSRSLTRSDSRSLARSDSRTLQNRSKTPSASNLFAGVVVPGGNTLYISDKNTTVYNNRSNLIVNNNNNNLNAVPNLSRFYHNPYSHHGHEVTESHTLKVGTDPELADVSIPGYLKLDFGKDFEPIGNSAAGGGKDLRSLIVGKGGYGAILKGRLISQALIRRYGGGGNNNNIEIAIKLMLRKGELLHNADQQNQDDPYLIDFYYEVALMSGLPSECPNLVQFIGYCEEPLGIIMKFYGDSVGQLLKRHTGSSDGGSSGVTSYRVNFMTSLNAMTLALDVCVGMSILHRCGIIHLDLKPDNILIEGELKRNGKFRAVICDFGFSSLIHRDRSMVSGLKGPQRAGISYGYSAPEVFKNAKSRLGQVDGPSRFDQEEDKKVDVYAFAITLFEVLSLCPAWSGVPKEQVVRQVQQGQRPVIGRSTRDFYPASLIKCMELGWLQDPLQRPSFEALIAVINEVSGDEGRTMTLDILKYLDLVKPPPPLRDESGN